MTKPNKTFAIRTAEAVLYLQGIFALVNLIISLIVIVSPSQAGRFGIDRAAAEKASYASLLFPSIPAAAVVLTLLFIRRRKRMPALIAALVLFYFASGNPILAVLSLSVVVILLLPSSKSFFTGGLAPETAQPRIDADPAAPADVPASVPEQQPLPALRPQRERTVEIRPAGPDEAETVHALMMAAFEEYRAAVPPSSALDETVESVREALASGQGAAILYEDEAPAAMVRYSVEGDTVTFFRLSVLPAKRRRGYAKRLVQWVERLGRSKGLAVCRCQVRQTVQNNVAMYQDMGFEITDQKLVVRPAGSVKALTMEKKLGVM